MESPTKGILRLGRRRSPIGLSTTPPISPQTVQRGRTAVDNYLATYHRHDDLSSYPISVQDFLRNSTHSLQSKTLQKTTIAEVCIRTSSIILSSATMTTSSSDTDTYLSNFIQALPKCELHMHLEGALTPALVRTFAERNHLSLPAALQDLEGSASVSESGYAFHDLTSFLAVHYPNMAVLLTAEDFRYDHDLVTSRR